MINSIVPEYCAQRLAIGSVPEWEGLKMQRSEMLSPTSCNLSHEPKLLNEDNFFCYKAWRVPLRIGHDQISHIHIGTSKVPKQI